MATGVSALVTWNRAHACRAVPAMLASLPQSWDTLTPRPACAERDQHTLIIRIP
jgi:hypothetical protein